MKTHQVKAGNTSPTTRCLSEIRFQAILVESKHDREGVWVVKLEMAQSDADAVVALSRHVQKVLDITVNPPQKEITFGRIAE